MNGFLRSAGWKKRVVLASLAFVFLVTLIGFAWAGKDVTLVLDGKPYYLKTKARTVGELLKENNLNLKDKDFIKPGINESIKDGLKITIVKAKKIKLTVDGRTTELEVPALRVIDALRKLNISFNPSTDKIYPLASSLIYPGLEIKVSRRVVKVVKLRKTVPFKIIKTTSPKLPKGKELIKKPGQVGLVELTCEITYFGGKEIARKVIASKVVRLPVNQLVLVGNKRKAKVSRGYSLASRVAVARGNGVLIMWATAYTPGYGCGYRTSTGLKATYGIVAVDPRIIPLGTRLYVPGYGYAVAADTGGKIKGNRIDLCFNDLRKARKFGRRRVKVYILN